MSTVLRNSVNVVCPTGGIITTVISSSVDLSGLYLLQAGCKGNMDVPLAGPVIDVQLNGNSVFSGSGTKQILSVGGDQSPGIVKIHAVTWLVTLSPGDLLSMVMFAPTILPGHSCTVHAGDAFINLVSMG